MDKKFLTKIAVAGIAGFLVVEYLKAQAPKVAEAVNPLDPNNIVNQGASATVKTVSGGRFLSVGDFLFNLFNPNAPGEDGTI